MILDKELEELESRLWELEDEAEDIAGEMASIEARIEEIEKLQAKGIEDEEKSAWHDYLEQQIREYEVKIGAPVHWAEEVEEAA